MIDLPLGSDEAVTFMTALDEGALQIESYVRQLRDRNALPELIALGEKQAAELRTQARRIEIRLDRQRQEV